MIQIEWESHRLRITLDNGISVLAESIDEVHAALDHVYCREPYTRLDLCPFCRREERIRREQRELKLKEQEELGRKMSESVRLVVEGGEWRDV